jgi:hypothetical protein
VYNKDSRENTLVFVEKTLNAVFNFIHNLDSRDGDDINNFIRNNLLIDLIKAKIGITNLKKTYDKDLKFCCDIDVILEDVDAKLKKYKLYNNYVAKAKELEFKNPAKTYEVLVSDTTHIVTRDEKTVTKKGIEPRRRRLGKPVLNTKDEKLATRLLSIRRDMIQEINSKIKRVV